MCPVRQRGNIWYVDLCHRGRRVRKKAGKSKRLAEQLLHDLELKAQRDELDFVDSKHILIKDFTREYLAFCQTNFRDATLVRYRSALGNFEKFLAAETDHKNLSEITPKTLEKFKIWRRSEYISKNGKALDKVAKETIKKGAKSHTINFEISAIKAALNRAVEWGYLRKNPALGIQGLKTDDSKRRRFLSEAECGRFLALSPEVYYPVFFTLLNTGMRRGELVNLEWTDIDFKRKVIKIQRKPFWNPKAGEREIPVNASLLPVLNGLPKRGPFVFTQENGNPVNPRRIRQVLAKIAKAADIPGLTEVHALRHTFISELIKRGVDVPTVQKLAGHSDVQTTMIYTHQSQEQIKQAVERLDYGPAAGGKITKIS